VAADAVEGTEVLTVPPVRVTLLGPGVGDKTSVFTRGGLSGRRYEQGRQRERACTARLKAFSGKWRSVPVLPPT
jgi:hypothetical protein